MNETQRQPGPGKPDRKRADTRLRPEAPGDRREQRIAAAERSIAEAYASVKATGVDPDSVSIAFAIARDCLAEAKECSARAQRELAWAQDERAQAQRERLSGTRYPDGPRGTVISDVPGSNLCPNPAAVQTPAALMETLRMYRVWAGKPSYRAMERQCGRRFAASTIHTALRSNKLPGLDMVEAIITACRGSDEHQIAFASAWRRIEMPRLDASWPTGQPPGPRALHRVSEPA